jgi:hypothetical protein
MNPLAEMKKNPAPESDLEVRTQCVQANLQMIHAYLTRSSQRI